MPVRVLGQMLFTGARYQRGSIAQTESGLDSQKENPARFANGTKGQTN